MLNNGVHTNRHRLHTKLDYIWYDLVIDALYSIDLDETTVLHSSRVANLYNSCLINGTILTDTYPKINNEVYVLGALLHDIGKACVPLDFLNKKSKLTTSEFDVIKLHSRVGKILAKLVIDFDSIVTPLGLGIIENMLELHHESCSGSGYPNGLSLSDIPVYVRLLSILDVYDALLSKRSYKNSFSMSDTLNIMMGKNSPLDQDMVGKLLKAELIGV